MAQEGLITLADIQNRFKSSGVYTFFRDSTASPITASNVPIRLIFGFSKQGIFNSPVFIEQGDFETAENLFGKIDISLERKGSYFHRSIAIALEEGPVLALNLLKLNNETIDGVPTANADLVPYVSLSTDIADLNGAPTNKLYASYYDKSRFWKPSKSYLLATRSTPDAGKILNFTNLSQAPLSIITKKSTSNREFDVLVKDWYGAAEYPKFLKQNEYIKDYFIDVIVIQGNFGPDKYSELSIDPVYGQFFDANGIILSKLDAFLARPEINVKEIFTGSIIPGFRDKFGNNRSIDEVVNSKTKSIGLLCALDKAEIDKYETETNTNFIDLVGHRILTENINATEFLSYKRNLLQDFTYTQKLTNTTQNFVTTGVVVTKITNNKLTVQVPSTHPIFTTLTEGVAAIKLGTFFKGKNSTATDILLEVTRISLATTVLTFDLESNNTGPLSITVTTGNYTYYKENNKFFFDATTAEALLADAESPIYIDWLKGNLTNGDKIVIDDVVDVPLYLKFELYFDVDDEFRSKLKISMYTDTALTIPYITTPVNLSVDSAGTLVTGNKVNVISIAGSINERFDATFINSKKVSVDIALESKIKVGQYLVATGDNGIAFLTKIVSIKRTGTPTPTDIEIETLDNIKSFLSGVDTQIERYLPIESFYDHLNLVHLPGFKLKSTHLPDGTNLKMKEILSMLEDSSIYNALIDPDMIDFRYMVDTFNGGLEPNSKRNLSRIIKARQKCLGILNTPSLEEFTNSTNPRFTTTPTAVDPLPAFNVQYVNTGGNLDENPEFLYTLPDESDGASFVGFFFPNLDIREDSGDISSIVCAPYVSNNFMKKYKSGNPYKSVAGPRRGQITGKGIVGTSYKLTRDDRGLLEEKGINPIYQKKNGDILIYGDETAYQKFSSVLNTLTTRDTLVSIEIDTERILENYIFEFNDDSFRTEVITLLRNYFDGIKNGFSAIETYDLVFDRSNNPTAIVREGAGIVDIIVEPKDILKKFINRITLKKGSAPISTGFVAI